VQSWEWAGDGINLTLTEDGITDYALPPLTEVSEPTPAGVTGVPIPQIPTGLTATAVTGGIQLVWTNPADASQWIAIDIERSPHGQGTYAYIGTTTSNAYLDPASDGAQYDYQVVARNMYGTLSAPSLSATATAPQAVASLSQLLQRSSEFVANPSFELGDLGWDKDPSWSIGQTGAALDGTWSAAATGPGKLVNQTHTGLALGQRVDLSVQISGSGTGRIFGRLYAADGVSFTDYPGPTVTGAGSSFAESRLLWSPTTVGGRKFAVGVECVSGAIGVDAIVCTATVRTQDDVPDGTQYGRVQTGQLVDGVPVGPVLNPNFMSGSAGWGSASGWDFPIDPSHAVPPSTQYLRYTGAGLGSIPNLSQVPVVEGDNVIAGCLIDGSAATAGSAWISAQFLGADGATIVAAVQGNHIAPAGSGYQASRVVTTAPAGVAFVRVIAVVSSGSAGGWRFAAFSMTAGAGQLRQDDLDLSAIPGQLSAGQLAANSVLQANFAAGTQPVGLVSGLPPAAGYTGPNVVINTVDSKLYRYASGSWTSAVQSVDIVGQLIASQIDVASLSAISAVLGNVTAGSLTLDLGNGFSRRFSSTPFGASAQFIDWFGPSSVADGDETEANGTYYLLAAGGGRLGPFIIDSTYKLSVVYASMDIAPPLNGSQYALNVHGDTSALAEPGLIAQGAKAMQAIEIYKDSSGNPTNSWGLCIVPPIAGSVALTGLPTYAAPPGAICCRYNTASGHAQLCMQVDYGELGAGGSNWRWISLT
jgi:hypothetical protein